MANGGVARFDDGKSSLYRLDSDEAIYPAHLARNVLDLAYDLWTELYRVRWVSDAGPLGCADVAGRVYLLRWVDERTDALSVRLYAVTSKVDAV
jgi:hypothetical protein